MKERNPPNGISLGKLAETSPSAITKVDKHGNIVYANRRAEEVLGLEESDITNRTYDDPDWEITDFEGNVFPKDQLPFQRVKNTEEPVYDVRYAIKWPDSERRFLSVNANPLFNNDGEFDGTVSVIEDITDQIEAKEKRKQGRKRYQKYFEELGDAVFILAMGGEDHGKILDVNPTAVEQTGYSREELVGMNMIEDLSLGPPSEMDYEEADQKISRGETVSFTEKKRRKDGTKYWTEVVVSPIEYEEREANLSINRDITERKEARKQLKSSEAKFRAMAEQAHDGLFIHSDDKILWANDRLSEIIGYSNEEIYLENPTDFLHPEDQDKVERIAERRIAGKDVPSTYEARLVRKDGEVRDCEFAVTRIKYNGKQAFLGAVRDVSERKKAEEELRESEKKYRTVFETTGTAMMIIEEDTTISLVNEEAEKLFGYSKEDFEGNISWTQLVAEDAKLEKMKEYHNLRRQDPSAAPNRYEFKLVDSQGNEKVVLMSIDIIPGTKQSIASLIDITDEKQSKQKLRQSFVELAETTSRVLGVRDPYTQQHELRVGELAREVGERMGLGEDKLLGLYIGGVLHDIGKIAIPETILTKPGELKEVEWKMIKSHPKVGFNQILEDTDFPWPVAEMTLHHHERLDGSGYPDGLEGDELTKEVRILGAVDVIEAMSTRRPYREARSKERTLNVIKDGQGNKFDPEVVEVLVEMIEDGEIEFGGE